MVERWERWRNPWDREYAKRGRLWRGEASLGPLPRIAPPPRRLVEVGAGDGKFLGAAVRAGYDCVAVDFSPHALKLAARAGRAQRILGDARRLPLQEGRAPLVVARYLLGSLRAPERDVAAQELTRSLQPGGTLLVEEFSVEDFRFGRGMPVEHGTFERNQSILTHYFTGPELAMLFPSLDARELDTVRTTLRIGAARQPRVSLRAVFSGAAGNSSSGRGA